MTKTSGTTVKGVHLTLPKAIGDLQIEPLVGQAKLIEYGPQEVFLLSEENALLRVIGDTGSWLVLVKESVPLLVTEEELWNLLARIER